MLRARATGSFQLLILSQGLEFCENFGTQFTKMLEKILSIAFNIYKYW